MNCYTLIITVYSTPVAATNFVLNSKSIFNWDKGYFIKVHSTYFGVKT